MVWTRIMEQVKPMLVLVNSHAVTLTGLTANTEYHYQVISTDSNGSSNIPVDYVFSTASITPDPIPEVSNIQVTTTDTTATIIWDTDVLSDSTVNFGLNTTYGTSETNASLIKYSQHYIGRFNCKHCVSFSGSLYR